MSKRMRRLLAALMLPFALVPAGAGGGFAEVSPELPLTEELPDLMTFQDGTKVETAGDWQRRRQEILSLYERYVYGFMPDPAGETVTYDLKDCTECAGKELTVRVSANGKTVSFTVLVTLPESAAPEGGYPCFIEYWGYKWMGRAGADPNCLYAASRGYAGINYSPVDVAADNSTMTGPFYELYPYGERPEEQTGVLLAWAWGASKILDALYAGAAREMNINPSLSLLGGVSRFGKSVAAAGAYDERFKVVIPSCSGAGGIAMFRTDNHGKTYDLTFLGGEKAWTNTSINEPFSNLTGGEGYWFCGTFRTLKDPRQLPVDQHMLCALTASPDRHLIIVTGITSEGWNNTEGQCLVYCASQRVWDLLGCPGQNNMLIHLDGHAILQSDMEYILDYCDVHLFGKDPGEVKSDLSQMKGNLFLEHNRDVLDNHFRLK